MSGPIKVLASSSAANCILVGGELLLDAGLSMQRLRPALNHRVSQLVGACITHEHGDHSRGVEGLLKAGVPIYSSRGTLQKLGVADHHRARVIGRQGLHIGDWLVRAFPVAHDATEPVGFVVERLDFGRLLYLTDTANVPLHLLDQAYDYLLIEANHSEAEQEALLAAGDRRAARVALSHLSIERVVAALGRMEIRREVWLTHLSDSWGDEERFVALAQAATSAAVYAAPS